MGQQRIKGKSKISKPSSFICETLSGRYIKRDRYEEYVSDYERPIVLERCCYTSTQHLRRRDFRDVVGRVHCRTSREHGVAGLGLELGARFAFDCTDHRLGVVSPRHGGAVDLGILLSSSDTHTGIWRNRGLDPPCCVQLLTSRAIDDSAAPESTESKRDTSWSEDLIAPCRQEKEEG